MGGVTLWDEPDTVSAFMCTRDPQCGETAILGPKRVNATGTCMNRTARCVKCGKVGELSYNLTLAGEKERCE